LDIGEKNLFGRGQTLNYSIRRSNEGYSHTIGFTDSTVMNTRYNFGLAHNIFQDELQYEAKFEKPFYSISTKKAHGIKYFFKDHSEPRFDFRNYRLEAFYGQSVELRGDDILRAQLILSLGEQVVKRDDRRIVTNRDNKAVAAIDFHLDPFNYEKTTYLEKYREVEDVRIGPLIELKLGKRFETLGSTSPEAAGEISIEKNFKLNRRDFFTSTFISRWFDREFNQEYYELDLKYYWRDFKYQSIVFHLSTARLESDTNSFQIGGTTGLRGFKKDQFEGKEKLIINIEDRIFTYKSFYYGIFEPGFVLFMDLGNTWDKGKGDKFDYLYRSVGAGFRLALLKAPGISLIRVDFGIPLGSDNSPIITVGVDGFF